MRYRVSTFLYGCEAKSLIISFRLRRNDKRGDGSAVVPKLIAVGTKAQPSPPSPLLRLHHADANGFDITKDARRAIEQFL